MISLFHRPRATPASTSRSRDGRQLRAQPAVIRHTRRPGDHALDITFRVTDAESKASPAATTRTASRRSSGSAS